MSRDTRPYVGLRPVTPVSAAGWRIHEPPGIGTGGGCCRRSTSNGDRLRRAEPPGTLLVSQGFFSGPPKLISLGEHMANSSILTFAQPDGGGNRQSRVTTVAMAGAMKLSLNMREPQLVRTPSVQKNVFAEWGDAE